MYIQRPKQAVELVNEGTISNNWRNTTTRITYEDRFQVKKALRNATVKTLRDAIRELDLPPAERPPYRDERDWKVGNKEELVLRVYLAWEDRFSGSTKAAVLAEAKRQAVKRTKAEIVKLQNSVTELEAEIEELESQVH